MPLGNEEAKAVRTFFISESAGTWLRHAAATGQSTGQSAPVRSRAVPKSRCEAQGPTPARRAMRTTYRRTL